MEAGGRGVDGPEPELTDAVFLVPVELLSRRTHTLVAALRVHAAVLTAAVVDATLIDV